MKVIINPPKPPRKEYTNLPEREPHRDLLKEQLRERIEQKRKLDQRLADKLEDEARRGTRAMLGDNANTEFDADDDQSGTFAPAPGSPVEPAREPRDILADMLSDRDDSELEEVTEEESSWKNSRWVPIIFVAALVALGSIWYFATHFEKELPLERVTVEGTHLLKDQEVIALAEINRDEKFYKIDLKQIENKILRHSFIKAAHPRREVNPATIVLSIEERQPVAMMRSQATGETYIIDRDGIMLRPKVLAGLKDPAKVMQVPLLSGISERDTVSYQTMAKLVMMIESLDSGALRSALGELRRTPTGAYVIYTIETQTPIFIGSPTDAPFQTALEAQRNPDAAKPQEPLFTRQLHLLAKLWKKRLESELRTGTMLYVDARFSGEIIAKQKGSAIAAAMKAQLAGADSAKKMTSPKQNIVSVTSPASLGHR